MKRRITDFLSKTFLFSNTEEEKILCMTELLNPEIATFEKNHIIYSPELFHNKIGFIYSGECYVERIKGDGNSVRLNTMKKYSSFGIMAVISNSEEFPTRVIAKRRSEILFITKDDFLKLIRRYPTIAMNVIHFLSNKIMFLNKKIATFSADTAEEKLANYILLLSDESGSDVLEFNCSKTSKQLNIGRASVYRVIDALQVGGLITYENKKLFIKDRVGLERISK